MALWYLGIQSIVVDRSPITWSVANTVNQAELRLMAQERILDAKALIDGSRWAYAYYVSGYAVECALKSCILARMIHTGGVFQDKKFAEWCWTHDFERLVDLAGLTHELIANLAANAAFVAYWGTVRQWEETSRYEQKSEAEAKSLYLAITNDPDGVLRWIQNYW